jgi:quinol monooxygenase YgiN
VTERKEAQMYGTVAKLCLKPGKLEAFQRNMKRQSEEIAGAVAEYVYRMDDDPETLYLAVVFESKDAYFKNANSPEQNERYEEMMQWLTAEPEWHDGEVVFAGPHRR